MNDSEEVIHAASPVGKVRIKIAEVKEELDDSEDSLDELEECTVSPNRKGGRFKINNKQLLLTYKTHLNKEKSQKWFSKKADVAEFYIAHETGDKLNPYPHSHVYVKFEEAFTSSEPDVFDIRSGGESIHPHIAVLGKAKSDEVKVKYYISKEDKSPDLVELRKWCDSQQGKKGKGTEVGGPCIVERVWACKTYQEALKKCCGNAGEANGIRELWESKVISERNKIMFRDIANFTWQKTCREILLAEKWVHRWLYWICDKKGRSGKSDLADYMVSNYNALYLTDVSSSKDIATLLDNHLSNGGSAKWILLDLPRAAKFHKIWATMESLLNGKITVGKWKGKSLIFDKPRLMVFANYSPPMANIEGEYPADQCGQTDVLSADRWNVYDVIIIPADKSEDGEEDRILVQRPNPDRDENYVRPKRFLNIDY
jgi:hypothetical protein